MIRISKTFFYFGLAAFVSLFFIELFMRMTYVENVSLNDFYEDIGRGRRRDLNYIHFNEGFGIGRFNDNRFIGKDFPLEKGPNSIRIALLGDSFVESFQVFERDYFGNISAAILQEQFPNKKIEVMNFGRSGFGLKDCYVYHKSFVDRFDPDIVLYIISGKDIVSFSSDPLLPKVLIEDNELKIDYQIDRKQLDSYGRYKVLLQNSVILNMLSNGLKKINHVPIGSILFDKFYFLWYKTETLPEGSDEGGFKLEALDITTKLILDSVSPEKVLFVNRSDEEFPEIFGKSIEKKGFDRIDLSSSLASLNSEGYPPDYWNVTGKSGHWNQRAHKRVAEKLSSELSKFIQRKNLEKE